MYRRIVNLRVRSVLFGLRRETVFMHGAHPTVIDLSPPEGVRLLLVIAAELGRELDLLGPNGGLGPPT